MTEERPPEPPSDETTAVPTPAAPPQYTAPAYTPPPIAPPQPAVAWAPPPAAVATLGQRTTLALAAGVLLVILGVLGALFSLVVLTIGRGFIEQFDFGTLPGLQGINDPNAFVSGVITFLGIFVLACSTFYIVGGVGVMRSKNWGRVLGIIIGILAGLLWLGSVGSMGRVGRAGDPSFAFVLLAVHAYIAIALLFFWRNKARA